MRDCVTNHLNHATLMCLHFHMDQWTNVYYSNIMLMHLYAYNIRPCDIQSVPLVQKTHPGHLRTSDWGKNCMHTTTDRNSYGNTSSAMHTILQICKPTTAVDSKLR